MSQANKVEKLSVVIPVLNERESLPELHRRLLGVLTEIRVPYEIIIVDDGSTDGTFDILRSLPSVKAYRFLRNYGKTAALACGIQNSSGDVIITMDGDLENKPEDIPFFIKKFGEGYDVVSGWRKNRWTNQWLTRRLPSAAANFLISKITGVSLHDHGCMFKLFRKESLRPVVFLGDMHRFLAASAVLHGAKIAEIPISFEPRKYGKSKFGFSRTFGVILDIIAFRFFMKYASRPMHFFGYTGFISIFLALASSLWAIYLRVVDSTHFSRTPLPVLIAIFTVVGILLILLGIVAEMIIRVSYGEKKLYEILEEHHG